MKALRKARCFDPDQDLVPGIRSAAPAGLLLKLGSIACRSGAAQAIELATGHQRGPSLQQARKTATIRPGSEYAWRARDAWSVWSSVTRGKYTPPKKGIPKTKSAGVLFLPIATTSWAATDLYRCG
jgi:hypothetical protein